MSSKRAFICTTKPSPHVLILSNQKGELFDNGYCWRQPEIRRSPVEFGIVYTITYKVLAPSQVVSSPDFWKPSTVAWLVYKPANATWLPIPRTPNHQHFKLPIITNIGKTCQRCKRSYIYIYKYNMKKYVYIIWKNNISSTYDHFLTLTLYMLIFSQHVFFGISKNSSSSGFHSIFFHPAWDVLLGSSDQWMSSSLYP